VFENGGVEGTYANYLAHHLGPELGHFRSFRFADHRLEFWCNGALAVATETYTYRIERRRPDRASGRHDAGAAPYGPSVRAGARR